jgi:hypothetical protein
MVTRSQHLGRVLHPENPQPAGRGRAGDLGRHRDTLQMTVTGGMAAMRSSVCRRMRASTRCRSIAVPGGRPRAGLDQLRLCLVAQMNFLPEFWDGA